MTAREQLNSYLRSIERLLRLGASLRGTAVLAAAALAATIVFVLIINRLAFSGTSVIAARLGLLVTLGTCAAVGLGIPLWQLNRRRAAHKVEATFPQFDQRLVTFAERDAGAAEPFLELLAADTLESAQRAEPRALVGNRALLACAGIGVASLGVLLWMIMAGPGFLGYGAALLWAGLPRGVPPFYDIRVTPGDATVRRDADELITAQLIGLQAASARLYARYHSTSKWAQLGMQPQPGGSGFQFMFAGLPEDVEYYVEAGRLRSRHFNIHVADLPLIKQIRVTYDFPAWTGMKAAVEDHGGDLRAIEGTEANLEITTDRPLRNGLLVLDDQRQIQLFGGQGNVYRGSIRIEKDGAYHVASLDQGQPVRLSEDYFIEADNATAPSLVVTRPGRDYQASPIEEVTVTVKAEDEFGLSNFALHYSVNGGSEQSVDLLKQKGAKAADGSVTLALEDFRVVPGDIVSLYATAKDARAESRTDMFFIQAEPFEREFSQSQQSGGGGGGAGGNQPEISQREKEIIAGTWRQLSDKSSAVEKAAENAKFLSGVQAKLRAQALSLAGRLQMRDLTQQNEEFNGFQQEMNAAAAAMGPASDKLQQQKWSEALPNEQKALQHLLRAEATFRQIQVAFGNAGGAGGGGAGRDLASLFDLELDTQKNQYETKQTADSAAQRNEEIDEALQKLDELARRQEDLANQRRAGNDQSFDQRWQQEMLRREAEELQKQIEQIARNGQRGSNSASSSGQSGSSGSQNSSDGQAQQALSRLREANDAMRHAASQQQSEADARRAAERLRAAQNLLGAMEHQAHTGRLDSLAGEADQLAREQRSQTDRIRQMIEEGNSSGYSDDSQARNRYDRQNKLADDRERLAEDLARLEQQMRGSARDLARENRSAVSALRDALGQLDESQLETRLQRGADRIRRGILPDPNNAEPQIGSELDRLAQQLRQAQRALGDARQQDAESALDQVGRLHSRLQALDRAYNDRGAAAARQSQPDAGGQAGRGGRPGTQAGPGGVVDDNGVYGGPAVRGGHAPGGANNWWIDTGNNSTAGTKAANPDTTPAPYDPERVIQESLSDLNEIRQSLGSDPETQREVQELIREIQKLDPKRFPGNPELVERLHNQVLNDVDKLELQLRRQADDKQSGQIRSGDPLTVLPGYEEAVADYFRRLSKSHSF